MAVIAAEREINMAITGIGYGRTLMYEIQKRVSEGTLQSASDVASRFAESLEESAEENDKVLAPVTRGVRLNRRIEGKDKVPYGEMAEDGVIEYNGVVFVCDYDHNRLTLGDTSNGKIVSTFRCPAVEACWLTGITSMPCPRPSVCSARRM